MFPLGQVQLAIERNWTGVGPSSMTKIEALGEHVLYREIIPGSGRTILASSLGGISVSDGYETLWALPPVRSLPLQLSIWLKEP
jgi:hypothetical protein